MLAKQPKEKNKKPKKQKYEKTEINIAEQETKKTKIFSEIIAFSQENPKFKSDFFFSVYEYFKTNRMVTSRQYNVLVEIYYQNNMQKFKPNKNPRPKIVDLTKYL